MSKDLKVMLKKTFWIVVVVGVVIIVLPLYIFIGSILGMSSQYSTRKGRM